MAVDTAAKRLSLVGFGAPWFPMVVIPDGTVDAADRADLLGLYAGLGEGGDGGTSNPPDEITSLPRPRMMVVMGRLMGR